MNINQMYPGSYLKATDFPQPGQLQIASIAMETVGQGQQAEQKPVMYFSGQDRGLVLNKTNANILVDSYGEETGAWMGQWVEIRSERVQFGEKMVSGIRIRALPQQLQAAPVQPGVAQAGMPHSGMPQAGMPQAGMPHSGMPQSGMPHSGMPQAGMPHSGTPQPGVAPAGTPQPGVAPAGMPQPGMPQPGVAPAGMPQPGVAPAGMPQPGMPQPGVAPAGMPQPEMPWNR